nr:PREDICTED: uncharacterized protein C8orf58 homolog [Bos mutus]
MVALRNGEQMGYCCHPSCVNEETEDRKDKSLVQELLAVSEWLSDFPEGTQLGARGRGRPGLRSFHRLHVLIHFLPRSRPVAAPPPPPASPSFISAPDPRFPGPCPSRRSRKALISAAVDLFPKEPRRDGAGEDLAHGCVVPGVNSTYRQIPDVAPVCSSDSWKRQDQLRGPQGQVPLLKLGSQDSGVEMAVGDSSLATSPSFSQDSLNFEPLESAESLALGALEPPAHLSRLLASRKLEQVLKRSHQLSVPPTSLSEHCHSPKLSPKCEMPHSEARGPEATEAESDLEDGLEQAEVVEDLEPEACSGLPGQGLRYLEHLCAVLEQVANLQQLCLQLQTQRGPADPEEEEETTLAPSPLPSYAPGSEVRGPWEWLSQTEETGAKTASPSKVGAPSASPPRLSEALMEPAHTSSSQEHKGDCSHWNKVKVLLNRIRWGSPRPAGRLCRWSCDTQDCIKGPP